jgi:uncharacterized protein (DUF983 family)
MGLLVQYFMIQSTKSGVIISGPCPFCGKDRIITILKGELSKAVNCADCNMDIHAHSYDGCIHEGKR